VRGWVRRFLGVLDSGRLLSVGVVLGVYFGEGVSFGFCVAWRG
jgi:hypothetical protein